MKFDIWGIFFFTKVCSYEPLLIKIGQKYRALHVKTHASFCEPLRGNSLNIYRKKNIYAQKRKASLFIYG
jgi:hypothetical protein